MANIFWKLKMLRYWLPDIRDWHEHVWLHDPDEVICCSGRSVHSPCGCGGSTYRDEAEYYIRRKQSD